MINSFKNYLILTLILLSACGKLTTQKPRSEQTAPLEVSSKAGLKIIFSHNINGETHPCGCRHFPLGGLPQVAGAISELEKESDILYVDTGDMLFPSSTLPSSLEKSLKFTAENIIKAQESLGLKLFIPGDQDFAAGLQYLENISKNSRFQFLLTNFKNTPNDYQNAHFKFRSWTYVEKGDHKIFLLGLVYPTVLNTQYAHLFETPVVQMKKSLKELPSHGYEQDNPKHRLVVLSHGDTYSYVRLAKAFPQIDWIIGSHNQAFLNTPKVEGNTKIVEVLSRNHYIGEINIDLKEGKNKDSYKILEMREHWGKKLKPNPLQSFIDEHKKKLTALQIKEQMQQIEPNTIQSPIPTASSCVDCHEAQVDQWKTTPHSLAFSSLVKVKENHNPSCVKCHSVGYKQKGGFFKTHDIINFSNKQASANYWKEYKSQTKNIQSVRKLNKNELEKYNHKLDKLAEKFKIEKNHSNVQCLNCHSIDFDHPFSGNLIKRTKKEIRKDATSKCLTCHNRDQSPEWYIKKKNGLPGKLNKQLFKEQIKKMSHPNLDGE
jgi:nitrate/TMAO reductase-like tetraheme cytochrome c subunit